MLLASGEQLFECQSGVILLKQGEVQGSAGVWKFVDKRVQALHLAKVHLEKLCKLLRDK